MAGSAAGEFHYLQLIPRVPIVRLEVSLCFYTTIFGAFTTTFSNNFSFLFSEIYICFIHRDIFISMIKNISYYIVHDICFMQVLVIGGEGKMKKVPTFFFSICSFTLLCEVSTNEQSLNPKFIKQI